MSVWLVLLLMLAAPGDELSEAVGDRHWSEVEELARGRLAAEPDDLAAHAALGRALLERSRELAVGTGLAVRLREAALEEAASHLERAREVAGAHELWLEARAEHPSPASSFDEELLERADQGDMHAAWLWARRRELSDAQALGLLRAAVSARPERARYALDLLERLLVVGDQAGAEEAWELAMSAGADADVLASWSVQVWAGQAQAERRASALKALALDRQLERDAWIGWYRAHALIELGLVDEALTIFDASEGSVPAPVVYAHAALLSRIGKHERAAEQLLPLAEQRDWAAYEQAIGVADALALERKFEAALRQYDALLAIERRDERAQRHRALTLWRGGFDERATAAFGEVNERWSGRADLLNDAALAALGQGDLSAAEDLFRSAIALPQSLDAHENLAALLLMQGGSQRAEIGRLLDIVLEAEPDRARALTLLARSQAVR